MSEYISKDARIRQSVVQRRIIQYEPLSINNRYSQRQEIHGNAVCSSFVVPKTLVYRCSKVTKAEDDGC